jgi:hypothetical protein
MPSKVAAWLDGHSVILSPGRRLGQNSLEQHFIDAAAKPLLAVDPYYGYATVVSLAKARVSVDIYQLRLQSVAHQQSLSVLAQMTASASVENSGVMHVGTLAVADLPAGKSSDCEIMVSGA